MDTFEKIKEIKAEYRNYLAQKHPNWVESTLSTHVTDAFYIWNNTVLPGFWKVFLSDDSLMATRDALSDHFQNEVKAENYKARTNGYFKDLQMLKAFFDEEFGGVENRIGEEFWQEETLYDICKRNYDGKISEEAALDEMVEHIPHLSQASHKITLSLFANMVEGRKYTRRGNIEVTICFIRNIGRDYGAEKMLNALTATKENIAYYYNKTSNKSNCMRKSCQQLANANNLDISFGDEMFDGIMPQTSDESAVGNYWPSLKDYNPGITKDMWLSILRDEQVTTAYTLQLLNMFLQLGGESTFNNLVEKFGNQFYYKGTLQEFSSRVFKKVNCAPCPKEYEKFTQYIIPFVGRMVLENDIKRESWKLRDELHAALDELNNGATHREEVKTMNTATDVGLNTILYGPPGTGKTYHTVIYAVAIIENKELDAVKAEFYQDVLDRYNEYKAQGRIEFTTFHQSYGYEEFIEGIRPVVVDSDDTSSIQYSVQPGMFKKFCERAERPASVQTNADDFGIAEDAAIWKVSLAGAGENEIRTDCLKNGYIRIGWEEHDGDGSGSRIMNALINRMQIGDIVFSCYNASTIDAIGIVTGEYELREEYEDYRSFRTVKWLAKDFKENIRAINGGKYMMQPAVCGLPNVSISDVYKLIEKYQPTQQLIADRKDNYVFIIDEINRGNISKIFGELITLIEESKRVGKEEGMKTLLPYSMKPFGVPENVYIIGTMNTADRSIATIDTALRRRFEFKEMLPDPEVVAKISVGNLSIKELLARMNRRIAVLYDREHTIGHAYFMPLAKDNSMEKLAEIFKNKVIPLLQEYFYEDYEKIRLVLADNQKKDERDQFILAKKINQGELFGSADIGLDDGFTYEINEDAFMNPEAYLQI